MEMKLVDQRHSVGIHTQNEKEIDCLARNIKVPRVIVKQPHVYATGGSLENALAFTSNRGGGTWACNSSYENLTYRNFIYITSAVSVIEADQPDEADLVDEHWDLLSSKSEE